MAKKLIIIYLYFVPFIITGCFTRSKEFWNKEKKKVEECRSKWVFKNLPEEQEIVVLLFSAKLNFDLQSYPNLLIGVTETQDTVAFLDNNYDGKIEVGDKVKLLPVQLTDLEKSVNRPLFRVHRNSKENDLNCNVEIVYYCEIKTVTPAKLIE